MAMPTWSIAPRAQFIVASSIMDLRRGVQVNVSAISNAASELEASKLLMMDSSGCTIWAMHRNAHAHDDHRVKSKGLKSTALHSHHYADDSRCNHAIYGTLSRLGGPGTHLVLG